MNKVLKNFFIFFLIFSPSLTLGMKNNPTFSPDEKKEMDDLEEQAKVYDNTAWMRRSLAPEKESNNWFQLRNMRDNRYKIKVDSYLTEINNKIDNDNYTGKELFILLKKWEKNISKISSLKNNPAILNNTIIQVRSILMPFYHAKIAE